ncbi:uncharacterized protein LOC108629179 [Ceratina calcarata]|uniref:Uncharacterized protein LOC108629179 n=1 Tax=Ceratina calcarata TaxID=156304 RepID=A0AAJ7S7Q9_9HYME|nr:uncharacterized protein LOC108629179 [Ceratina calcarata]
MVKLTEEMVVARTRISDFSAVKKLNCWGTELTDVSILRKMKNVEVLSLRHPNVLLLWTGLYKPQDHWLQPTTSEVVLPTHFEFIVIHLNLQNGQTKNQNKDDTARTDSRSVSENVASNTIEMIKEYDERPAISRHNGDYDERRSYAEFSNNDTSQRTYASTSPRTQYSVNESMDDRRSERNNYDYDNRLRSDYKEHHRIKSDYEEHHQPSSQPRRMPVHHNEDSNPIPGGWVRHSEKEKCRSQFHYHRRPVTRNSNILSAVLCLVKELDYPSLEVVEMAVRNRMDELEE